MVSFIGAQHLIRPLMDHNWQSFARCYNGPNYAANNYDGLLSHFYVQYSSGQIPDLSTRTAQIYLSYLGYSLGAVDGRMGPETRAAVAAFRSKAGLAQSGDIDAALLSALQAAVLGTPAS
jgi:peptidoglycan hydrolase-like protein with peptidoglycan-binding domain